MACGLLSNSSLNTEERLSVASSLSVVALCSNYLWPQCKTIVYFTQIQWVIHMQCITTYTWHVALYMICMPVYIAGLLITNCAVITHVMIQKTGSGILFTHKKVCSGPWALENWMAISSYTQHIFWSKWGNICVYLGYCQFIQRTS